MTDSMTSRFLELSDRVEGLTMDARTWEMCNEKMVRLDREAWEHFLSGVEIAARLNVARASDDRARR